MQVLTEDGRRIVEDAARRHGVSEDAVHRLLVALVAGGGRQAQFSHPDLGGMGQWSQGGMIMIGDMFNQGLKQRVDALCTELASAVQQGTPFAPEPTSLPPSSPNSSQRQSQSDGADGVSLFVSGSSGSRWPAELGSPSSTGSQNDLHYAVFPGTRRLAVDKGGTVTVYDTGDHRISGFSQQQSGSQSVTFTSQHGLVRVADLKVVSPDTPPQPEPPAPTKSEAKTASPSGAAPSPASLSDDEIFSRIERLADLRKKDIITAEEYDAKKAELLARL
ncbi:SHOCT domain-containing protein [soil metagenome]